LPDRELTFGIRHSAFIESDNHYIDKFQWLTVGFINDCSLHLVDRLCQKEGYGYVAKQQKRQ
jgi:hypothetical protein